MSGPGDLYALCREYLDACADALVLSPAGPIGRIYVSPGPPAWDCCPQLTVHAGGPVEGDTAPLAPPLAPGQRPANTGSVHLVNMTATVLRCTPTVETEGQVAVLPDPALLEMSAEETLGDCWTIWNHLLHLRRAGTLFPSPGGTREMFLDPAVALTNAGGCSGWQLQVRVALGGYPSS